MSEAENKTIVRHFLENIWGKGDLSLVEDMIAANHVHHLTRRDMYGPEGVKQLVTWFRAFLPDLQIVVKDMVAEGDKVAIYFTFLGTDTGGYKDRPPSGQAVAYDGTDIFRLSGGKIVERWGVIDTLSMLYQIGALA